MKVVTHLPDNMVYVMGLQPVYDNGPHLSLWAGLRAAPVSWAGLRAACGLMTITGIPNCLNYCESFIVSVYTKFINMATGHIIQPAGGWRPMVYVV
jgi:hypothetical protein